MLDRPKSQQRDPFDEWWDTLPSDTRAGIDLRAAKQAFRAGYAAGCKIGEARKLAKKKADRRATAKGWKSLPADWKLELVE